MKRSTHFRVSIRTDLVRPKCKIKSSFLYPSHSHILLPRHRTIPKIFIQWVHLDLCGIQTPRPFDGSFVRALTCVSSLLLGQVFDSRGHGATGAQRAGQHEGVETGIDGLDDGELDRSADCGEAVASHQDNGFVWIGLWLRGDWVGEVGGEGIAEFHGVDEHEAWVCGVVDDFFVPVRGAVRGCLWLLYISLFSIRGFS